jgi:lysophospholipase L1-like esterase
MLSTFKRGAVCAAALGILAPAPASAQINFEKSGYYLSLGDSVPAGEGALPVTHGFVYQLYDRGVFGRTQEMDFANIGMKGATAAEVLAFQVPQALCIQPPRIANPPTVITLIAGANDFFVALANGLPPAQIPAAAELIAATVETIIRALVFGQAGLPPYCATSGIPGVTVLVANYYPFDHPDPQIEFVLDLALQTFGSSLAAGIAQINAEILAAGKTARVGYVDTFKAMEGRPGLLLINRQNGFGGGLDFEIHPSNAGHTAIAEEFARVWTSIR